MLYRATVPADCPKSPGLGTGRAPGSTKKSDDIYGTTADNGVARYVRVYECMAS